VPDSNINALPGITDIAYVFVVTMAVDRAALGNRDRPFEGIDDVCGTYLPGGTCKPVATIGAASRCQELSPCQRFEQLADRGQGDAGRLSDVGGTAYGTWIARKVGEHYGSVIREFADSEHGVSPRRDNKGPF